MKTTNYTLRTFLVKGLLIAMTVTIPYSSEARLLRPMDFIFNPAVEGGSPYLTATPSTHPEDTSRRIKITAFAVDTPEAILGTQEVQANAPLHFTCPNRGKGENLGIRVEEIKDGKSSLLIEWHAKYVSGKSLMNYKGNPQLKRPADFKSYWNRSKKELAAVPMNAQIIPWSKADTENAKVYKVLLNSFGGMTIACWYTVPKDVDPLNPSATQKKYPAIQVMPGHGAEEPPMDRVKEGFIVLSMNPRGHGPSNEFFKLPEAHHLWNIEDSDNYYYRAAYMDCVRGIDFLSSRPEVDSKHIGAEGGSQGGALTIALCSLDSRVKEGTANVPYLSNFWDFGVLSSIGSGMAFIEKMKDPIIGNKVQKTLSYIDVSNLAGWVKCPLEVTVGLQDRVCPPLNGIVVINQLQDGVIRKLVFDPAADHEITPLMRQENMDWHKTFLLEKK